MFINRTSSNDFSLRFSSYVIKGLMIVLRKEYDLYYKSNQSFIALNIKDKGKSEYALNTFGINDQKRKSKKKTNQDAITDFSLFGNEDLLSDTYDPRLFGKKLLSNSFKENSASSSKSKNNFVSLYESDNKTIKKLLLNNSSNGQRNKSNQKNNMLNISHMTSPIQNNLNEKMLNCNTMMLSLNNNTNNFSSINLENNNIKSNLNNDNDLLSNFINFDIDMDPNIHINVHKEETPKNDIQMSTVKQEEQKDANLDNKMKDKDKEYVTPVKLITSEHNSKEIIQLLNSHQLQNKGMQFNIKDLSYKITEKKQRMLQYDTEEYITLHSPEINDSDPLIELERYKRLFNKVIDKVLLRADFDNFVKRFSTIEFDQSLIVTEAVISYDKELTVKKDFRNQSKSKSQASSYDKLRNAERGENSSLDNSASVISNLSLKDVFDTNKKLINKTSTVINYPTIVGIIEEEDSNFNLNSMNTFNLKSTFNNNNNLDFNFDEINEEDKENEDSTYDALYNNLKSIKPNGEYVLEDLASSIQLPLNKSELKTIAFYHLLLHAQKNDLVLKQNTFFDAIYLG